MKTAIVIPARYASSRLPGKPLLKTTGKYLIQHVYERACASLEASQVIVATHSPLLMSLPDAHLLEVGDWGLRRLERWDEADLVQSWRSFLEEPDLYLRHLMS